MISKLNTIEKISKHGLVAVVRGNTEEMAYKTAESCIKGGIKVIELTFTVPNAIDVIKKLIANYKDVVIGAGTVLDLTTANLAIISGAKFIVSPSFSKEVAKTCNVASVPYIPGCMTPTEVQKAMSYGSDIIKVFPGDIVGPSFVSDLRGPFPQVNVMPSGGVNLTSMADWIKKGSFAVSVGGSITKPAKDNDYDKVTKNAKEYVKKVIEVKDDIQK
ncbi:bifunctional 2-keto-4-hydroxyglutarate aldolase/2-keto-3-deoxy-6-phosphogluconate aldolase [Ligilactobacillus salivarius]|nr:bifunctional 2-keto-4-hydroxyglutarate aldolase/2-keto-3-deoxy-6-phosphogluconate aldolase [Ligilactobacillus salivarius]OQR00503.1 bifunctional 2-keto-4-hydroxyglutarate aldolase/2-keto-3-deoxy-6-phosphogluconate aldolase [Ligilactobacillus salivarius]